jgi:OTU-like cysteine protease
LRSPDREYAIGAAEQGKQYYYIYNIMGSKNKGHRDGGTRRGGKRPGAAHSVDAGEDQPSARASQHQKNCNKSNRKKKGKEPDSDDDEDAQLKRYVEEQGLELLEMNADGNCLFRSLSDQLCGDFGSKHAIIRQQICDFMEMNKEDFEVFLVYEDKDDHEQQEEDARDYEHYIEQMRKDGEWGGHLELNAAARLFRYVETVSITDKMFSLRRFFRLSLCMIHYFIW